MLAVPEISCTLLEVKFYYRIPRFAILKICKLWFNSNFSNFNNDSVITKYVCGNDICLNKATFNSTKMLVTTF